MITKFESTAITPDVPSTEKSNNTLIYIVLGLGLIYLGYKYVYLPSKEKKENEDVK
jgi:hypothetical protein